VTSKNADRHDLIGIERLPEMPVDQDQLLAGPASDQGIGVSDLLEERQGRRAVDGSARETRKACQASLRDVPEW
jgi:hypothetical protein